MSINNFSHIDFIHSIYNESKTKLKTRLIIINITRELFSQNLISEVSVTDICLKCNIERKTFYRYYPNKEKIAYEIRFCVLLDLLKFQDSVYTYNESISAYNNLILFIDIIYKKSLIDEINTFRSYYKFLSHFDYMNYTVVSSSDYNYNFVKWVNNLEITTIHDILKKGQLDKSINLHEYTPLQNTTIIMNAFSAIILRGFLTETNDNKINANYIIQAMKYIVYGMENK